MGNPRYTPKLSGISNKDQREVVRKAQKLGANVELAKGKPHVKVTYDGRMIYLPLTSHNRNAALHARRKLRKIGVNV